MSTGKDQKSFIETIIEFFKTLFSGMFPEDKDKNKDTPNPPKPDDNTKENIEEYDNQENEGDGTQAHLDPEMGEATFRYGNTVITITKSKKYVAIQTSEDRSLIAAMPLTRRLSKNTFKETTVPLGFFELVESQDQRPDAVNDALDELRSLPTVNMGTHVYHNTSMRDDMPLIPTGQLYVVFNNKATKTEQENLLNSLALKTIDTRGGGKILVEVTQNSPNPIKVTVALQNSGLVEVAEPELQAPMNFESFILPSDSLLKEQWHLQNKGQHGNWTSTAFKAGADAKVVEAWNWLKSMGTDQITVAVIDSGFDLNHPDLKGNGNKIVAPWDFDTETPDVSPRTGDWHGTPCAGVAVGAANGIGIVGAAPNSKLMPMRSVAISDTYVEKMFNHAMLNGADVISNSWGAASPGFTLSTRMLEAIRKAATQGRNGKGCVIVFAAGNSNVSISNSANPDAIMGFATHPNVIAVSASNSRDERSSYSNYGNQISVCAPSNGSGGAGILTADVGGTMVLPSGTVIDRGYDAGDYTPGFGGTSSACPLVAGVCALILSANPNLTAAQVKSILEKTTDKIGNSNDYNSKGHSIYFGYGRINSFKAVQMAKTGQVEDITPAPIPPPPPPAPNTTPTPTPTPPDTSPPSKPVEKFDLPFESLTGAMMTGTNEEHIYKVLISDTLDIKLDSPMGDANADFDLYVRKNELPEPSRRLYDDSSVTEGSNEHIALSNVSGLYLVLIRAYQGSGAYNLGVGFAKPTAETGVRLIQLEALTGGILRKSVMPEIAFRVSTNKKLTFTLKGEDGTNIDLYVKKGARPKWNDFDGRGIKEGADEKVEIANPQPGTYYILVRSENGSGYYNLWVNLV
ncbi:MAG: S8 family serine peptidase [Sphingobacteriales bacterium]|nr:MAG: S8 family serine peptidase [Sphingobacteriales bacterium]